MEYEYLDYDQCFQRLFEKQYEYDKQIMEIKKSQNLSHNYQEKLYILQQNLEGEKNKNNELKNDVTINKITIVELMNVISTHKKELKKQSEEIIELKNSIDDIGKLNKELSQELKEGYSYFNELFEILTKVQTEYKVELTKHHSNIKKLNIKILDYKSENEEKMNDILYQITESSPFEQVIKMRNYLIKYLEISIYNEVELFDTLSKNGLFPITFDGNINDFKHPDKVLISKYINIENDEFFEYNEKIIKCKNDEMSCLTELIPRSRYIQLRYINRCYTIEKIDKSSIYKTIFQRVDDNVFLQLIEAKEEIIELEDIILDSLERFEFMKKNIDKNTKIF